VFGLDKKIQNLLLSEKKCYFASPKAVFAKCKLPFTANIFCLHLTPNRLLRAYCRLLRAVRKVDKNSLNQKKSANFAK